MVDVDVRNKSSAGGVSRHPSEKARGGKKYNDEMLGMHTVACKRLRVGLYLHTTSNLRSGADAVPTIKNLT